MKSNQSLKNSKNTKTVKAPAIKFTCEFCDKDFVKESSLVVHCCERKRRWNDRDLKDVKLGFYVYQKFYELSFQKKHGNQKTFNQFIDSSYYSMFVAFGKYLLEIKAINQDGFIAFIIKNNYKLKNWTDDKVYEDWIKELSRRETPLAALERNILLMQQWASDYGDSWNNFLKNVNPQLATEWIRKGRISPWLLYSESGNALFSRLSDEQLGLIEGIVDPVFWGQKLKANINDLRQISSLLKEYDI